MVITDYSPPVKEVKKVDSGADNALMSMDDIGSFIKLFVAQMNNQDPLSPSDSSQLFQQTSQITMVEQLISMNKKSDAVQAELQSLDKSLTSTYLGRVATASIFDADGKPKDVQGLVLGVSYGKDGSVKLGLDTGDEIALKDVTSISIYTGN